MHLPWQVIVSGLAAASFAMAQEGASPPSFEWTPLVISAQGFSQRLDMLNTERDEYATHLASVAANRVNQENASQESLDQARRLLSLAFRLSPRNKRALVVNFQLSKQVTPEAQEASINPPGFARLLLTRGQFLQKNESWENQLTARMFIAIAAELDPKNEDAVYASEVARLDYGAIDWTSSESSPAEVDPVETESDEPAPSDSAND